MLKRRSKKNRVTKVWPTCRKFLPFSGLEWLGVFCLFAIAALVRKFGIHGVSRTYAWDERARREENTHSIINNYFRSAQRPWAFRTKSLRWLEWIYHIYYGVFLRKGYLWPQMNREALKMSLDPGSSKINGQILEKVSTPCERSRPLLSCSRPTSVLGLKLDS